MQCRLCLEYKKLCKSHIFPEYFYDTTYNNDHSFIRFSSDKKEYNAKMRKGFYDRLLCKKCEEIIQTYEDHGKFILYGKMKPLLKQGINSYSGSDYNYYKFKLFIMSLLWRASITKRIECKSVALEEKEELFRSILLNRTEVATNNHPILIAQGYINYEITEGIFLEPSLRNFKNDDLEAYTFIIDGIIMQYIGSTSNKSFLDKCSLKLNSIFIGNQNLDTFPDFKKIFDNILEQDKFSV